MNTILPFPLRRLAQCVTFVSPLGLSSLLHAAGTSGELHAHGTGTWNPYARVQGSGGGNGTKYSVVLHINYPIKDTDFERYRGYVSQDTEDKRNELIAIIERMTPQPDAALAELVKLIKAGSSIAPWSVSVFRDHNRFASIKDGIELVVEREVTEAEFPDVCKFLAGERTDAGKEALQRVFQGNLAAKACLTLE